jgi:predicted nucleic acid-binding protein
MHQDAARAIGTLLARGEELCITPQNLIEFWAVATRPMAANGLGLTIVQAARRMRWLKRLFKLQPDTPAIFSEWENLVAQYQVIGKQAHDARLVAAMKVHGLSQILTFNNDDFKRFADITSVSPQAIT